VKNSASAAHNLSADRKVDNECWLLKLTFTNGRASKSPPTRPIQALMRVLRPSRFLNCGTARRFQSSSGNPIRCRAHGLSNMGNHCGNSVSPTRTAPRPLSARFWCGLSGGVDTGVGNSMARPADLHVCSARSSAGEHRDLSAQKYERRQRTHRHALAVQALFRCRISIAALADPPRPGRGSISLIAPVARTRSSRSSCPLQQGGDNPAPTATIAARARRSKSQSYAPPPHAAPGR